MQNEQDLEKLVHAHTAALLRYCTGLLGCEADAQDAVQKTFIKAWQQRHTLRHDGTDNERAWLYRIAYRTSLDMLRAIKRAAAYPTPEPLEQDPGISEELRSALLGKPEWIMLDNMPPAAMREAVAIVAGRCKLEASGGIDATTIRAVAETGVDAISLGCLSYGVILVGGIVANGLKGAGKALKDFSLPISMSFRMFGALLSGLLVTELVYYYVTMSFVLPVIIAVLFTMLHALIQAYVLTTLTSMFYGEATEKNEPKAKAKKVKKIKTANN